MMLRKILYACSVMVFIGTSMATQSVAAASGKSGATTNATVGSSAATAPAALPLAGEVMARAYTMPEGTPHHTVYYNTATGNTSTGGGGIASGPTPEGFDDPVYANEPPPSIVFPPGANRLIADDLITVAVGGCAVSGYEFVVGRSANWCSLTGLPCGTDADCGGNQTCNPRPDQGFTATYALYDGCPGFGGQIIPTTEGMMTFADNALFTVLVDFGGNNIQTASTVWLGIEFNKTGAGWVVGTPASTGFTENIYHHPNFPCVTKFTGTPLYAGFHAKVFCSATPEFEREFLAYFNPELDGLRFGPQLGQWIADDVTLIVPDCIMTSYEIGSVGSAPYTLTAELRASCNPSTVIEGTQGVFQGGGGGSPELARFSFPEGIALPNGDSYWVAWKYSNNTTSAIVAEQATLGESGDVFGLTNRCNINADICASDGDCGPVCSGARTDCFQINHCSIDGDACTLDADCGPACSESGSACFLTDHCSIDNAACNFNSDCGQACSGSGTPCVDGNDCPVDETCDPQNCLAPTSCPGSQTCTAQVCDPPTICPDNQTCNSQSCNLGCDNFFFGGDPFAGFNVTIRCLGDAPTGACCDLTSIPAGDAQLCRVVTQIACTGDLTRYNQGAKCPLTCSVDGQVCTLDADCGMACNVTGTPCASSAECPLGETCVTQTCLDLEASFAPACGTSSCCTPPGSVFGEGCSDLERNECLALTDVDLNPGVWQRGFFCNQGDQNCVRWVCRFAETACDQPQPDGTFGCNNANCCDKICGQDPFCCEFQWDSECVARVNGPNGCTLPVSNDACSDPSSPQLGAVFVDVSTSRCGNNNNPCTTNADCTPGVCNLPRVLLNTDGAESTAEETFCCVEDDGFGAVWAKFIAPATTMLITTSASVGPSTDPQIQVSSVGDNTDEETACGSLVPIGCDNDSGSPTGQARLSLRDLTIGDTYYLMLANAGANSSGTYEVEFETPTPDAQPPANNTCVNPTGITPGISVPFDLTNATGDCPLELAQCLVVPGQPDPPNPTRMDNDVWFQFTAIGSGVVTIDTCEVGGPDTTMTIYRGGSASCPPDAANRVGCSNDAGGACGLNGLGSSVTFNVISFELYMIRVGGVDGSEPAGMLNVSGIQADCQPNFVPDVDEIACGAGNFCGGTCSVGGAACGVSADCTSGTCDGAFAGSDDCQGNTLPDECDIALGISQDCNVNGIPDGCDISGGASQDCNTNGIPDECDGGCTSITIASSTPPNGEIDARQPTSLDGTVIFGWDSVVLTFDGDASAVTTGDLAVASTSGVAPTISAIAIAGTDVTVTLSGPIPAGAWTTVTYSPDGSSICLGFLPGDVNADGTSAPSDILAVIDSLNGIVPRPVFATDADRSGVAGPEDILRVIDLLNGASAFNIWLDVSIGATCP